MLRRTQNILVVTGHASPRGMFCLYKLAKLHWKHRGSFVKKELILLREQKRPFSILAPNRLRIKTFGKK